MIGRSMELAQILDLLGADRECLVTVVRPGGIGKTRLALAAASQPSQQNAPVWCGSHWQGLVGLEAQVSIPPTK
jgi:hypothetical protein